MINTCIQYIVNAYLIIYGFLYRAGRETSESKQCEVSYTTLVFLSYPAFLYLFLSLCFSSPLSMCLFPPTLSYSHISFPHSNHKGIVVFSQNNCVIKVILIIVVVVLFFFLLLLLLLLLLLFLSDSPRSHCSVLHLLHFVIAMALTTYFNNAAIYCAGESSISFNQVSWKTSNCTLRQSSFKHF